MTSVATQFKPVHGMDGTPEYRAWVSAKARCFTPTDVNYHRYGARGITMAPEWAHDFAAFYAHVGPRPVGHSLDRIDNEGNYEPGNVRWATSRAQAANRRTNRLLTHQGVTQPVAEWARQIGMTRQGLRRRLEVQRMSVAEALTTPRHRGTP